jgi:hypothetical protein
MATSTLCVNKLNTTNISNATFYGIAGCCFCCVNFPNSNTCINYVCFCNTNKITTLCKVCVHNGTWPNVINILSSNLKTAEITNTPVYTGNYFKFYYSV